MSDRTHCVVFRLGGTHNFTWHRSLAMTADEALAAAQQMDGRAPKVMDLRMSLSVGLPDTFDAVLCVGRKPRRRRAA